MESTRAAVIETEGRESVWRRLLRWTPKNENTVLLLLTLIIGSVVGLVVVAFIVITEHLGNQLYPPDGGAWRRLVVPLAGSLITGFLLTRYFPEARGSGIPQTKAALYLRGGFISFRTVLGRFGLSATSLASGIALGREGPSVHVGAGIASVLGRRLGLPRSSAKALLPVGSAAALAAAFNTPIAAVLFSLEEVMGDMNAPVLGSVVVSSATSWIVLHLLLGDEPLFHVPAYQLVHPVEFVWYGVLGVVGGLVSTAFVRLLLWQRKHFLAMPASTKWLQPAAGALLVGALGWYVPAVMGVGYNFVGQALNGQMLPGVMAMLVLLRILTTSTCYASGNAGGIFGPTLFIGAMTGGAVGSLAHILLPDYTGGVGAYALVGMGAAFAGIVRVPLTSVIMVFEMTRDYSIIVPLMIANLVSYLVASRFQEEPIYEALQHQDGVHLPSGSRARHSLLTVGNAFDAAPPVLTSTLTLEQAWSSVDREKQVWPVVDAVGFRGMVTARQLEAALQDGRGSESLEQLVADPGPVESLLVENFPHLHTDHSLDEAMQRLARQHPAVLPVVSRTNIRELKGTVSLENVYAAYRLGEPVAEPAGASSQERWGAPMGVAVAGMLTLFVVLALVHYSYSASRTSRAEEASRAGAQLLRSQRPEEAVEQFRKALSISPNVENRQALGLALVRAGHYREGAQYLNKVVEEKPESAPARLGLAQIAAADGNMDEAVMQYHKAIEGSWPAQVGGRTAQENRIEARIELAGALRQANRQTQTQAELMALAAEIPPRPELQRRLAAMLTEAGLYAKAMEVYRSVLKVNPMDVTALKGLGSAQMAAADFGGAAKTFGAALRVEPNDPATERQRELCLSVVSLDPSRRGLHAVDRYSRSKQLLSRVTELAQRCTPDKSKLEEAQNAMEAKRKVSSYSDSAEELVNLARELWAEEAAACGGTPPDETLEHLMPLLSQAQ